MRALSVFFLPLAVCHVCRWMARPADRERPHGVRPLHSTIYPPAAVVRSGTAVPSERHWRNHAC